MIHAEQLIEHVVKHFTCKFRDIFNARHNDVRPFIREGKVLHLIRPVHLANVPWGTQDHITMNVI
jgi:hypothetical protein